MNKTHYATWIAWTLQIAVAGILFQTLFFKFTGAEESKYIFSQLHAEPWGRIGSGAVELVAVVLLLYPGMAAWGALLAAGVMLGAIGSHITVLGIEVKGDHGLLFSLAVVAFAGSLAVLVLRRTQLPLVGKLLSASGLPTA